MRFSRSLSIGPSTWRIAKIASLTPVFWFVTLIDAVLEHGELANYYLAHSARADMYRRLGRTAEARSSYEKALALTQQGTGAALPAGADSAAEIKFGIAVDFPSPQRL